MLSNAQSRPHLSGPQKKYTVFKTSSKRDKTQTNQHATRSTHAHASNRARAPRTVDAEQERQQKKKPEQRRSDARRARHCRILKLGQNIFSLRASELECCACDLGARARAARLFVVLLGERNVGAKFSNEGVDAMRAQALESGESCRGKT